MRRFRLTRRRRIAAIALLVALPALGLLGPLLAMAQEPEFVDEVDLDSANCFGHHAAETPPFRTTVLLRPLPLAEVPAGQEFDLPVEVQVAWKQEMRAVKIGLNLSQAPNLGFVGEKDPFTQDVEGDVPVQGSVDFQFPVEENATEMVVSLAGDEGATGGNDLDLFVLTPAGVQANNRTATEDDSLTNGVQQHKQIAHEEVRVLQTTLLDGGVGQWTAKVTFPQNYTGFFPGGPTPPPVPGLTDHFTLHLNVFYNSSRVEESYVSVGHPMAAGEVANVTFRLLAKSAGPVTLGVLSLGWAHYTHTDAQAVDDGNFSKSTLMRFVVGDKYVVSASSAGAVNIGFDPLSRLLRQYGFLLGWLGFFLIPPSLLLGGTFGAVSVRALNKFSGSARQRVLWHNALSYVLLGVGLTHMSVFLLEVTYNWTVGVVWGTLTLASIIGLGITGALQNRIAKSWGYGTWRFTHFLLGMLVILGIALHVVVDGVDLQFLRDYFLVAPH